MSNKIQVIQDKSGNNVFPITHEKAVRDSAGVSLDAKLAALESKTYVEAWDGASTPVVANIPAGIVVTYEGTNYTGTLAASSSTDGKIYLIKDGTEYDRYASTTNLAGTRVWTYLGTTAMSLTGYATEDELNQLSQKVTPLVKQTDNLIDKDAIHVGYLFDSYHDNYQSSANYIATDYIPVTVGKTYIFGYDGASINAYEVNFLKADHTRAAASASGVSTFTVPANTVYVVISNTKGSGSRDAMLYQLEEGTTIHPYVPYGYVFDNDAIKDKSLVLDKMAFTEIEYGKNHLDVSTVTTNKWIGANGGLENVTSDFGYTDYIPVNAGQAYHLSNKNGVALCDRTDAYIAFYDATKTSLGSTYSVASNNTDVTAPAGAYFMRVSLRMNRVTDLDAQIEKGDTRTAYAEYEAPKTVIDPDLVSLPDNGVTTEKVKNGAITRSKIASDVSLPATPRPFNSDKITDDSIAAGDRLYFDYNLFISKNIAIVASIEGAITSVSVGIGYLASVGEWVEITPTQLIVKYGSSGTVVKTYTHGLTLGTKTTCVIEKTVTDENVANGVVRTIDGYGNIFRQQIQWWGSSMGAVFVLNGNASGTIGATLSLQVRDLTKKIWMFGDSYFNYESNARWPYYPVNWGFTNFLIDGRGGENASEGYADFLKLLSFGAVPSYVVWALGMNSGADSNGAVNATWLAQTQAFITKCEGLGITPILATIPTVPTEIHTKLNEWVRASGYRYIDFAAAVEADGTQTWRGWGTDNALLSNDEVHPTAHGAAELACRAIQDFPELTITQD